jgi:hypothetical protein
VQALPCLPTAWKASTCGNRFLLLITHSDMLPLMQPARGYSVQQVLAHPCCARKLAKVAPPNTAMFHRRSSDFKPQALCRISAASEGVVSTERANRLRRPGQDKRTPSSAVWPAVCASEETRCTTRVYRRGQDAAEKSSVKIKLDLTWLFHPSVCCFPGICLAAAGP